MVTSRFTLGEPQQDPASGLWFRLRRPLAAKPRACLLLLLLHEVGGSESHLADLAAAVADDTLVVLPRGPLPVGAGQFAWFTTEFTEAGPRLDAEQAGRSRHAVLDLVAAMQQAFGVAAQRTVIAGYGAGGIVAASVALTDPERFAGFAVFSGPVLAELQPRPPDHPRPTTLRGFIAHDGLPEEWLESSRQLLGELGVDYRIRAYPGGDGISAAMTDDFRAWIEALA